MTLRLACVYLAAATFLSAEVNLDRVLKGIEERYNRTRTLQVAFQESYSFQGRKRTEAGNLSLRKPGKMRWEYTSPAGKLFVSDGKNVYFYSPDSNRAEKMKLKETDDMRAPLAFLLGKLDFRKDFKEFRVREEAPNVHITAIPKSDQLPYREVSFLATPDWRIQKLTVNGQDGSILDFTFTAEKVNPPITDQAFKFEVPKGAEYVDSSQGDK